MIKKMPKLKKKRLSGKKALLLFIYVIYISFILIFSIPYFAGDDSELVGKDYKSQLEFPVDGSYSHYNNVVMKDKESPGRIYFEYHYDSNTLYIQKLENIEELGIDCKLLYESKCEDILGQPPVDDNYYKNYFMKTNNGLFTVIVNTDTPIEKLQFFNTAIPQSVLVNNQEWWDSDSTSIEIEDDDVTIRDMPTGLTTVKVFFEKATLTAKGPMAKFTATTYYAAPDEAITFDASESTGELMYYFWDFGDYTQDTGKVVEHSFDEVGEYEVTLTVRDENYFEDTHKISIQIEEPDFSTIENSSSENSENDLVGSHPN